MVGDPASILTSVSLLFNSTILLMLSCVFCICNKVVLVALALIRKVVWSVLFVLSGSLWWNDRFFPRWVQASGLFESKYVIGIFSLISVPFVLL